MTNNLSEQDIRAIVRDEIRSLVGANSPNDIEYLPTEEAFGKLGYASGGQLRNAISNGIFRLGTEVQDRRSKGALYSRYYFNIPACIRRLNTSPEERGA